MLQNALVLKALSVAFYASLIRIPSTYFKKGHVSKTAKILLFSGQFFANQSMFTLAIRLDQQTTKNRFNAKIIV